MERKLIIVLACLCASVWLSSGQFTGCSKDADCYTRQWCEINSGYCTPLLNEKNNCTHDRQCVKDRTAGRCVDQGFGFHECAVASIKCKNNTGCLDWEYCNNRKQCEWKKVDGVSCKNKGECYNNRCFNGICRKAADATNVCNTQNEVTKCGASGYCLFGSCFPRLSDGATCQRPTQCRSSMCLKGRCGILSSRPPAPPQPPLPPQPPIDR